MSRMITDALGFKPASSNSFGTPVQTIEALALIPLTELVSSRFDSQRKRIRHNDCAS